MIILKTASYNIRLDPAIKAKAEKTFAVFGLDLSEAINVFLHASILQRGFPFELREPIFNFNVIRAMEETEQIIEDYNNGSRSQKTFSNAHDLIRDILDEVDDEGV